MWGGILRKKAALHESRIAKLYHTAFIGDSRVCMLSVWEQSKKEGANASADLGSL